MKQFFQILKRIGKRKELPMYNAFDALPYLFILMMVIILLPINSTAQGVNLVKNGGFEKGFTSGVGNGWTTFLSENVQAGFVEEKWEFGVIEGNTSQLITLSGSTTDYTGAGIFQTVHVTPGMSYQLKFNGFMRSELVGTELGGDGFTTQYAIDLTGNQDWSMVDDWTVLSWSEQPYSGPANGINFRIQSASDTFSATGSTVTIFIRGEKKHADAVQGAFTIDAVRLMPTGNYSAPPDVGMESVSNQPTAMPTPTAIPPTAHVYPPTAAPTVATYMPVPAMPPNAPVSGMIITIPPASNLSTGSFPTSTDSLVSWYAEYYNNPALQGTPVKTVQELAINHHWNYNSPGYGIPADRFSVRWSSTVNFQEGQYNFIVNADDGMRVWIDGQLVIDAWKIQSETSYNVNLFVSGGAHRVQVAYFEDTGPAIAHFSWRLDPSPPAMPPLIVDNNDLGFTWGGSLLYRRTAQDRFNNSYFWTWNTKDTTINFARWMPTFKHPGTYEVFAHIPSYIHATSKQVTYEVHYDRQVKYVVINQSRYYNQWASLGTFYFNGRNVDKEYIVVTDNTGEAYGVATMSFDAMKFVLR